MKVKVEREVNLDWLLKQLDQKSKANPDIIDGYEVLVDRQLLRDAHDVITQFRNEKPDYYIDAEGLKFTYRD